MHKGRWHGEVAIRLLEVDGNNQDHLKLFKKEVMNYRQTRHENVILFMGACMVPPHLAIITRCGRRGPLGVFCLAVVGSFSELCVFPVQLLQRSDAVLDGPRASARAGHQ